MSTTFNSITPDELGRSLGLMPVPLFHGDSDRFVMLNGAKGNFCISNRADFGGSEALSAAWSADVGHFLHVRGTHLNVFRWDQPDRHESFSISRVRDSLEQFHAYLEKTEPNSEHTVIRQAIRVYSQLIHALGRETGGHESLTAFLYLLACVVDGVGRGELDLTKWDLEASAADLADTLSAADWGQLYDSLQESSPFYPSLTPMPELMLRHAAGPLFQQAHYRAFLPRQTYFDGMIPDDAVGFAADHSSSSGVYFTPPALARTLVEQSLRNEVGRKPMIRCFDPACGSGEFLREAVRYAQVRGQSLDLELIGWDKSPASATMAKFILSWEKRFWDNSKGDLRYSVEERDSLDHEWDCEPSCLLMNPPFASWSGLNEAQRDQVKSALGGLELPKPNLAAPFFLKAAKCVSQNGKVGAILPSSVVDGSQSDRLRTVVAADLTPRMVATLGSQTVFENAMVDAYLYVGQKTQDAAPALAIWVDHRPKSLGLAMRTLRRTGGVADSFSAEGYSIYRHQEIGRDDNSWAPKDFKAYNALRMMRDAPLVQELFNIQQGVRLGHDCFIVALENYELLSQSEKRYFRPAVMNRSIRDGKLSISEYIFYPDTQGLPPIESEEDLARHCPRFYAEYLKPNEPALRKRAGIKSDKWWLLTRARTTWLPKPQPKIVSTYFGDAGSFAFDETGDAVVTVGFGWTPKKKRGFSHRVLLAYVAILNSRFQSELLRSVSVHVGGGQLNLSKKYLAKMPLPDLTKDLAQDGRPDDQAFGIIEDLARFGKAFHKGNGVSDLEMGDLDALVQAAYQHYRKSG